MMTNLPRLSRTLAAGALLAGALLLPAQAGAATIVVEASGQVANISNGSFTSNGRSYQTGYLKLDLTTGSFPFLLSDGDTIEFAVSLDDFFTVPGSSEQFFGLNFEGDEDQEAAGASNSGSITFLNASGLPGNPVGVACGNCLSAIYGAANAGAFSFSGLSGSTTVALNQPYAVSGLSISYQISEAISAVPEPATWGMMITGFGMIGGGMHLARRKQAVPISHA